MKNLCIKPFDESVSVRLNSLNILNEFKRLGFTTRSSFIGVVQDNLHYYKDYNKLKHILNFWESRRFNESLNSELNTLLETIKSKKDEI
jgi:hypothetical protein